MSATKQIVPGYPNFGDIFDVDFEPVVGSEIGKKRPALVVSNNVNNQFSETLTVLPITSKPAEKVYRFEVHVRKGIAGLTSDSRIKANQIRTIDKKRVLRFRGSLPAELLAKVEEAL